MTDDTNKNKYTQRTWDRTVGWGPVPKEYAIAEDCPTESHEIPDNDDSLKRLK